MIYWRLLGAGVALFCVGNLVLRRRRGTAGRPLSWRTAAGIVLSSAVGLWGISAAVGASPERALRGALIWAASMAGFWVLMACILVLCKRLLPERSEFNRAYTGQVGLERLREGRSARARYRQLYKHWRIERKDSDVTADDFLAGHLDEV